MRTNKQTIYLDPNPLKLWIMYQMSPLGCWHMSSSFFLGPWSNQFKKKPDWVGMIVMVLDHNTGWTKVDKAEDSTWTRYEEKHDDKCGRKKKHRLFSMFRESCSYHKCHLQHLTDHQVSDISVGSFWCAFKFTS